MTLPEGIYHRFTCDDKNLIHAMRLFKGNPVWTPFNRPQEDHPSRQHYVKAFVDETKA
jgi:1,2-dihydroxy-3-keto-5-methylthiopentene dioxygenase